jgi:hypothetical protein
MAEKQRTYEERRQDALAEMTQTKNLATGLVEVRYGGNVIGEYADHREAIKQGPHDILKLIKAKTSNPNH